MLLALMLLAFVWMNAGNVIIKAKMDSATVLMGKLTALHIEVSQDKQAVGHFVAETADTLTSSVEIAFKTAGDTTDLGNNRIQINRDFVLQAFDSGQYVLPPIQYVMGTDTFITNPLSLKVMPVAVDSLKTVHDYKPVEDVPFRLFDYVPDFISDYWWVYLLIAIILLAGLFVYYKWLRKGQIPLMPKKKVLPPYEEAIAKLEVLSAKQLWQSGQAKAYFTELTDILRVYIDRRFGINAVEMTSTQIIDQLYKNAETKLVHEQVSKILEIADYVKFANMMPLPDDNELAFRRAVNFVNDTKPAPVAEADAEEADEDETEKQQETKKEDKV